MLPSLIFEGNITKLAKVEREREREKEGEGARERERGRVNKWTSNDVIRRKLGGENIGHRVV